MLQSKIKFIVFFALLCAGAALMLCSPLQSSAHAQQPTGNIPTVTGTPLGTIVALYLDETRPQQTVYAGPSSYLYPAVGLILAGQEIPAYGFSEDKNWIQIYYPGVPGSVAWVYAPFVQIVKIGPMPIIISPPTPTPASTPIVNIDSTLMAAYVTPVLPTRLPTFTAPAPLSVANFANDQASANSVPMGLLIFFFGFVGAFGVLISFLRGR